MTARLIAAALLACAAGCASLDKPNPYQDSRHKAASLALIEATARAEGIDTAPWKIYVKDHAATRRNGQRWEDDEGRASRAAIAGNLITIVYECDPATGEPDPDAIRHEPFHVVQFMRHEFSGHPVWMRKYGPARWHD